MRISDWSSDVCSSDLADHTEKPSQEQTSRQAKRLGAKSQQIRGPGGVRTLMLRLQVEGEALLDAPFQPVSHVAVGLQPGLAVALDEAGIEGVPELHLAGHGAGQLDRLVLRLRRQRDDEEIGRASCRGRVCK